VLAASGHVAMQNRPFPTSRVPGDPSGPATTFALTDVSRNTLVHGSAAPLDAWVAHNRVHWRALGMLEETLTQDGPRDLHHHLESPDEWATYQRAMLQTALPVAAAVAALMPVPRRQERLLDLGGSHGLYGAEICRRLPPMRSRVIDLPEAVSLARALGDEVGIGELVEYVAGDVLTTDLGEASCDVVFMGNLVHHFDEGQRATLLANAHRALRAGGVVAIWDLAPPPEQVEPDLVAEGFSLLFYLSSASACRSPDSHARDLGDAGFKDAMVHRGPSPTHVLVSARRD
jgi:SAM-dependent methyltransferase